MFSHLPSQVGSALYDSLHAAGMRSHDLISPQFFLVMHAWKSYMSLRLE